MLFRTLINGKDARTVLKCCLLLIVVAGCTGKPGSGPSAAATKPPKPAADPWKIVCNDPSVETPALLWNGLIGVRIGRSGAGLDAKGAELPFFMIDEYDTEGEEKIRTLTNPLIVRLRAGGKELSPDDASRYEQTLDMQTGLMTTTWEQDGVTVTCVSAIHPDQRVLGQRWRLRFEKAGGYEFEWRLTPFSGQVQWNDKDQVVTFAASNAKARLSHSVTGGRGGEVRPDKTGLVFSGNVDAGSNVTIDRVVTFGISPNWVNMLSARGTPVRMAAGFDDPPPATTWDAVEQASREGWAKRWETDIEIDGPVEDQQAVRSFLFYLRSSIHPDGRMSVSPCGLSNQQYNGHVFWDADTWVFPALALIDPERARVIPNYRLALLPQARRNFEEWLAQGRPIANGKIGDLTLSGAILPGAKFPWESSVSGRETVPGPSRFQDHITGTVAFSLQQSLALGLTEPVASAEVAERAWSFFARRVEGSVNGTHHLKGTMSPDEYFTGDDDLYTNLIAQRFLSAATSSDPNASGAYNMHLPKDDKSFLTYEGDPVRSYKQAAAVLAIYPLQYPPAEEQAKVMMDRFADKVTKNGPAMTDSIHALIWARLGEDEKAYEGWRKSWMEFVREPHLLFSEKRNKDVSYFTTGAGGCLQTVLYGFLGFRLDSKKEPGAPWTKKLVGENWLSIKPNLPPAWKSVKFKNFRVLGESHTLTATHDGVTVSKGD